MPSDMNKAEDVKALRDLLISVAGAEQWSTKLTVEGVCEAFEGAKMRLVAWGFQTEIDRRIASALAPKEKP
ncbi:MAG: hypothetical protein FJ279_02095 [Planctomycetes bacterium]|nr:hypothetical protein [Planctomycetota bacterium]